MGVHGFLTRRAQRDCAIRGVDPDEIDDLLDHPITDVKSGTEFDYYLSRTLDGRCVELTCTRTPPILVYRVIPLPCPK